jgi:hypothetical protein
MKVFNFILLNLLVSTGAAFSADQPVAPAPYALDPLQEAVPLLQASYVDFAGLHYQKGDQLTDLLNRSNGKIAVEPPQVSPPVPIVTATLPYGVAYWRMESFTPKKDWGDLAGNLKTMIDFSHVYGAILDLRSNTTPEDFAGAAQVLHFFVPADTSFFKYLPQKGDGVVQLLPMQIPDREFHGPLVVLTNEQTSGAAEALAASLKADGALVVGRATAGSSAFFEAETLSSSRILRFAVAPPPADDPGHPIKPDIVLNVDEHTEKAALVLIRDNHVSDVIQESAARHRLSEAALVQGQDPEWDEYLSSLEQKPVLLSLPVIHDTVLTSALDSLKAIRFSEQSLPPQPATATASLPGSTSIQ